jgi:hypothetical protein
MREKFFDNNKRSLSVRKNYPASWYSIRVQYEPIPPAEKANRGEWFLQATLVQEYRDVKGGIKTKTTPLGNIDVDNIDSVELRQAFYTVTDQALDNLQLDHETREQIAAELALLVRPPAEDGPKRPRIGLGALLPTDK